MLWCVLCVCVRSRRAISTWYHRQHTNTQEIHKSLIHLLVCSVQYTKDLSCICCCYTYIICYSRHWKYSSCRTRNVLSDGTDCTDRVGPTTNGSAFSFEIHKSSMYMLSLLLLYRDDINSVFLKEEFINFLVNFVTIVIKTKNVLLHLLFSFDTARGYLTARRSLLYFCGGGWKIFNFSIVQVHFVFVN